MMSVHILMLPSSPADANTALFLELGFQLVYIYIYIYEILKI
jgi:hypothetical protein